MGPTEFYPGSHLHNNFSNDTLKQFAICSLAGSAILFDYRIKHRGTANNSKSNKQRPMLYFAYAQTWYVDRRNERSGKSVVGPKYESPKWVSRVLSGEPMPIMKWANNVDTKCDFDPRKNNHPRTEEDINSNNDTNSKKRRKVTEAVESSYEMKKNEIEVVEIDGAEGMKVECSVPEGKEFNTPYDIDELIESEPPEEFDDDSQTINEKEEQN